MADAYAWFASRRGISRETLDAFAVAVSGREVRYPYPGGATKVRVGLEKDEEGGRRFFWEPATASGQVPFLPPDFQPAERMIVLEGETDTMAAYQALPEDLRGKVSIVGLSGFNSWKSRYVEELFGPAKRVFVVLDNDDPYESADAHAAGQKAWTQIKGDLGRKARKVTLPQGINDVAEFFQQYDWAAFQELLKSAAAPVRHYKRLDLSQDPPPTDWLVEDFLVRSEAAAFVGDGGVGKSFIMMALALAVAGGDPTFLGLPIKKHGPVLYVDEENSAQLVLQRLNALGLDKGRHLPNLEFLWYSGVDLLGEPEKLLEEALDMEPALIVVDSLSRVAIGAEENSNPDMTRLMRGGVIPLARETGAAVVLVHHTSQTGTAPRGATAIRNSADQVISAVAAESKGVKTGRINIFPSKPRRQTRHLSAVIEGDVEQDGFVRVNRADEEEPF